ncbi:MAG: LysR substrate-binding domain-containing protein [Parasphingorhabdus sp.]
MKSLPLSSLRALAAVYSTGGVRPAGRLLGVAHSAVSHHLKELEAWLDVPLFKRDSARGTIEFTNQGETLGRKCLAAFKSLETSVTDTRETRRANAVVVATTASVAVRWLLPRLPEFQEANKSIQVSVVAEQQLKLPAEDGADISIRMGRKPQSGIANALMDDTLFPVMSPAFAAKIEQRPLDLGTLPLIHDRDPNTPWTLWKRAFGPPDLNTSKGARFTSSDLVLRAAEQGLGVALARGRLAEDSLANGSLVPLFEDQRITLADAYWVLSGENSDRSSVQRFRDWLHAVGGQGEALPYDFPGRESAMTAKS